MTPAATALAATEPRLLDAVARLRDGADPGARLALERIALARSMARGIERTAERAPPHACAAKGIDPGCPSPARRVERAVRRPGRQLRFTIRPLQALARHGNTPRRRDGRDRRRPAHGACLPSVPIALFAGVTADVHLEEGVDERELHDGRARFKAPTTTASVRRARRGQHQRDPARGRG